MLKKYLSFYKRGLLLVNNNPLIYGTVLFFSIGPQIDKITKSIGLNLGPVINIVSFIIGLLTLGSLFVSIKTLDDASEKKEITQELVLKNYKKTFVKSIKLMLLTAFFAMLWFGFFPVNKIMNPLSSTIFSSYLRLFSIFLLPIVTYFGIYYAVKDKSFIDSFINSLNFSFKNILFNSFSLFYGLVNLMLTRVQEVNGLNKGTTYYFYGMIASYITLVISSASLLYLKDKEQTHP